MVRKYIDLTGQRFHKLTVLSVAKKPANLKNRCTYWECACDCGNVFITQGSSLRSQSTKSCGCNAGKHSITHGMTKSPEFACWSAMLDRCKNPNHQSYKNYGGRGINVCDEWSDFITFFSDMGLRPSKIHQIDRIDNNGDYCPENCRWVTQKENLNNKRNNHMVEYDGKRFTVSEVASSLGLSHSLVTYRARKGLPIDGEIRRERKYDVFGEMLTLNEASNRLGISVGTLQSRVQRGTSLVTPFKPPTLVTVEGSQMTVSQASEHLGLSINAIRNRIAKGHPLTSSRLR